MSVFKVIIVENKFHKNTTQRRIVFRSKWEIEFAKFLDSNTNVVKWRNDYPVKYRDKYLTQKIKNYYIDFYVEMKNKEILLIEVKPLNALTRRVETKSMRYKKIHTTNYLKNLAKFDTVEVFCQKIHWKFFIAQREGQGFRFYHWDTTKKIPILIH